MSQHAYDDGDPGPIPPDEGAFPVSLHRGGKRETLYADVAGILDGTLPEAPEPTLLYRNDGHALFYAKQVNVLFGDPESGKTWVALVAAVASLKAGGRVLFMDLDHNGPEAIVVRLLELGASEDALRDRDRFRYVEPEDRLHLLAVVGDCSKEWAPDVAVVDSVGELLPLLGGSSNSPDDFTIAHGLALKPLAMAGAGVLAIDHLPKNAENKANGPTGTAAKRRAIGGVAIRVVVKEPFIPGKGGSAYLTANKDRHGGLRRYCLVEGGKEPVAGLFTLMAHPDGTLESSVRAPDLGDAAAVEDVPAEDLAALDALDPPPQSVRDVQIRLKWRTQRATSVLRHWRFRASPPSGGNQGNTPLPASRALPGNGQQTLDEADQ